MGGRLVATQETLFQQGVECGPRLRVPAPDSPCQVLCVGQHRKALHTAARGDGIHDGRVEAAGLQTLEHLLRVGARRKLNDGRVGQVPLHGLDVRRSGRYSERAARQRGQIGLLSTVRSRLAHPPLTRAGRRGAGDVPLRHSLPRPARGRRRPS